MIAHKGLQEVMHTSIFASGVQTSFSRPLGREFPPHQNHLSNQLPVTQMVLKTGFTDKLPHGTLSPT